jgi:hypothetical protein
MIKGTPQTDNKFVCQTFTVQGLDHDKQVAVIKKSIGAMHEEWAKKLIFAVSSRGGHVYFQ